MAGMENHLSAVDNLTAPRLPNCALLSPRRGVRTLLSDSAGAAIIEAAFVLPLVFMLLVGVVSFGQWFMVAHSIQQAADEGARAAIAGIDEADRVALAEQGVAAALDVAGGVEDALVTSETARDGDFLTVTVRYRTQGNKWLTMGIVPLPLQAIERRATVKLAYL